MADHGGKRRIVAWTPTQRSAVSERRPAEEEERDVELDTDAIARLFSDDVVSGVERTKDAFQTVFDVGVDEYFESECDAQAHFQDFLERQAARNERGGNDSPPVPTPASVTHALSMYTQPLATMDVGRVQSLEADAERSLLAALRALE